MKIKGAIFDMDGLLIDTEIIYQRFWCESANLYGYPMKPEHVLAIRSTSGATTKKILQGFFGENFDYEEVKDKRIELMEQYIDSFGFEVKKGSKELLDFLKEQGIKISIASTSPYPRVEKYLKQIGLFQYFDSFTTGEMVKKSKPAPDIYILAAQRMGIAPKDTIALEDSPNGVISAHNAGCNAIMIPDLSEPDESLMPYITATYKSLDMVIDYVKSIG